jgi:conjugative transfer region protein (TIGR03750 family)
MIQMDEHHTPEIDLHAAPEIDRVNVEPVILLGLSNSEAMWVIGLAFAFWIPAAALVMLLKASMPLYILLATTGPLVSVWLVAKKMAVVKRNRPDLYYVHAMRLWASKKGLRRSRYINHIGEWDVGRSFKFQFHDIGRRFNFFRR